MKKNHAQFLITLFFLLLSSAAQAKDMIINLPKQNPHPPQTALDKKRVAFAISMIKTKMPEDIKNSLGHIQEIKYAHIIPEFFQTFKRCNSENVDSVCPEFQSAKNLILPHYLKIRSREYIVHAYTKSIDHPESYTNILVVLSEDDSGQIIFKRILSLPDRRIEC